MPDGLGKLRQLRLIFSLSPPDGFLDLELEILTVVTDREVPQTGKWLGLSRCQVPGPRDTGAA